MLLWSAGLLAGCGGDTVGDVHGVVVVMVADTLGQAMSDHTGSCEALQDVAGAHGVDLACLSGGFSPSSWTAEAHTRFLWPQTTVGSHRALEAPPCGSPSVLEAISSSTGGRYLWGADNSVLSESGRDACGRNRTAFTQGSDKRWETRKKAEEVASLPEEDHPVHDAVARFAKEVDRKDRRSVSLFLNALEPGGHRPRCWFDPATPACDELFVLAVSAGLADAGDDRASRWLDVEFYNNLQLLVSVRQAEHEARWRPLFWQTTAENVLYYRGPMLTDRLDAVLGALADVDRLDDLRLVLLGDHGENPCVARGLGDDNLNCGHNGLTTEYTGFVPVFVAPASMADAWVDAGIVATDGRPWSTVNLAYGLADDMGVPRPADWPELVPPGSATSWTCLSPDGVGAHGVHVEGEVAISCANGICDTTRFGIPVDEYSAPESVAAPDLLTAWGGDPDWFTTACSGE